MALRNPEPHNSEFDTEYRRANHRANERRQSSAYATAARYDAARDRVILEVTTPAMAKLEVSFSPRDAQGLETASAADLAEIEISPSGLGIHFPALDADIYLPALMEGLLGSREWMASRLGAAGGARRSPAKTDAARKNGKLGGRPKKKQTS